MAKKVESVAHTHPQRADIKLFAKGLRLAIGSGGGS